MQFQAVRAQPVNWEMVKVIHVYSTIWRKEKKTHTALRIDAERCSQAHEHITHHANVCRWVLHLVNVFMQFFFLLFIILLYFVAVFVVFIFLGSRIWTRANNNDIDESNEKKTTTHKKRHHEEKQKTTLHSERQKESEREMLPSWYILC